MSEEIKIKIDGKYFGFVINLFRRIIAFLLIVLKVLYWLILVSLPFILLYYWRFGYSEELLNYLKVLIWPLVVLTIVLTFKDEISNFINEISELGWGSGKVKRGSPLPRQGLDETKNPDAKIYDELSEYKKKSRELTSDVEVLKENLLQKEVELDFERAYVLIFRSQIYFLTNLQSWGPQAQSFLETLYAEVQKSNPSLRAWSFTVYTSFLFRNNFIEIQNEKYSITQKGNLFLNYILNVRGYIVDAKLN